MPALSDLKTGQSGVVRTVSGEDEVALRLRDLGMLPGTRVEMIRQAPLRDPVVYELRGYRLCLRRSEAARVEIEDDA